MIVNNTGISSTNISTTIQQILVGQIGNNFCKLFTLARHSNQYLKLQWLWWSRELNIYTTRLGRFCAIGLCWFRLRNKYIFIRSNLQPTRFMHNLVFFIRENYHFNQNILYKYPLNYYPSINFLTWNPCCWIVFSLSIVLY